MSVSQNLPARIMGRYRVERLLGEGGMARVLYGVHEELDLPVAIKMLKEERGSDLQLERLRREARAVAKLRGGHVVRVLDSGEDPEAGRFIVMEYVDGSTLAAILDESGPLSLARALDLADQIAEALSEAHAAGIVHRDIKPSNVLVVRDSSGHDLAKVADFGIAKTPWPAQLELTESSAFLGSPKYMSPEQLMNPQTVDARSDIWSFGVLLFEMLTREGPFRAYTPGALLTAVLNEEPSSLLERRPEAPPALDALVRSCLTRDLAARAQTIDAVRERIAAIASELPPSELRRESTPRIRITPRPAEEPTLAPHAAPVSAVSADVASPPTPRRLGRFAVAAAALVALAGLGMAIARPGAAVPTNAVAATTTVLPAPSGAASEPPVSAEPPPSTAPTASAVTSAPARPAPVPSAHPAARVASSVAPPPTSAPPPTGKSATVDTFVDLGPRK